MSKGLITKKYKAIYSYTCTFKQALNPSTLKYT